MSKEVSKATPSIVTAQAGVVLTPQALAAAQAAAQAAAGGAPEGGWVAAVLPAGQVASVEGAAWLQEPGKAVVALQAGAQVPQGAVLVAGLESVVRVERHSTGGSGRGKRDLSPLEKLIADVDQGRDRDATAAGVGGGDENTDAEGGLRVDRVAEAVTPDGLGTTGIDGSTSGLQGSTAGGALGSGSGGDTSRPYLVLDNPGLTGDATPTVSGTTDLPAGSLISVSVTDANGLVQVLTGVVGADGRFSVTPSTLPDGLFTVVAQAGGSAATSGGTVDTTPPILRLDPVSVTGDNTPVIQGSSNLPAGTPIKVTVVDANGASQSLQATVDANGRFSVSPSTPLTDGRYTVQVSGVDEAGNRQTSTTVGVVDTKAPEVAVSAPELSNSKQPQISGTTDLPSGSKVAVQITDAQGHTQNLEAVVRPDGRYVVSPTQPLPDGRFTVTVTGTDSAGNSQSQSSSGVVDSTAPLSPAIGHVYDNQGAVTGDLSPGGATDDSRPTLSGTAEPGSTVTLYDNGVAIGTALTDASGHWTFTPAVPLPAGPNSLSATATDAAGNTGPSSAPFLIEVETGAPTVPTILHAIDNVAAVEGLLGKGSSTNDTTPTVEGTGRPGETITLYANGQAIGSATVDAKGLWSITTPVLGEQTWHLSVQATNIHGGKSPMTGDWPLTVDTQAPRDVVTGQVYDDVGVVRGPITEGSTTDDSNPTWRGQGAEPGTLITVYDKGVPIGTTVVDSDGLWEFSPSRPLGDGPHSITVTASDAAGNTSAPSQPLNFNVDTSAVTAPSITAVLDDVGPGTGLLSPGQTSNDNHPTLSGLAKPGSTVQVWDGETLLGTTTANATGNWSYTPALSLADGPHDFVARSLNAQGVPSEASNAFRVLVDTQAPDSLKEVQISDDVGRLQGPLQDGDHTDDTTPTFSGHGATPGDTITVYDGNTPLGSTVVGPDGRWSFTPLAPLEPGEHALRLTVTDPAGNTSAPTAPIHLTVDLHPPEAPTIGGITDDQGVVRGDVADGAVTDDARPTIWGQAEPGAMVEVFDGATLVGRAIADQTGAWRLEPSTPLPLGGHVITAVAVDAAGNTSGLSAPREFVLMGDSAPQAPAIVNVMDDQGSQQGHVPKSLGVTDDTQPTIHGTGQAGDLITLRDGNTVIGTATVNASGLWQITPATPLADGLHNLSATATNAAGNISPATGVYDFRVDTQDPSAPNSLTLTDNVGPYVGTLSNGQTTDDATPTLSGTVEPQARVTIYDQGTKIGEAVADANGQWHFTPTEPLADGPHSFTTTQTDLAGNTSPLSPATVISVDTQDVVTPTITAVRDDTGTVRGLLTSGEVSDDTVPTLQGTAPAGTLIHVYDGNTLLGTAEANTVGRWSFTPSAPLADGPHHFSATATNAAQVVSAKSALFDLTVDTQGPAAPSIDQVGDDVGSVQGGLAEGARTDDTTPTLKGQGEPGATIEVYDGNTLLGSTVVDPQGQWQFTPASPLSEGPHSFSVVGIDVAGNRGTSSGPTTVIVDTHATGAPTVTISEDANDNGIINLAELQGEVNVRFGLPSGAMAGDTLSYKVDGGQSVNITLTSAHLSAGEVLVSVPAPASGHTLTVQVSLTDLAGNTSPSSSDSAVFDLQGPDASTTSLVVDAITADNIVNAAEAGRSISVTGQALGEFEPGDVVTLTVNGKTFSGQVGVDGSYSIAVPGADLRADPDAVLSASLRATDPAGNQADIAGSRAYSVDTQATGAPGVSITEDANDDGFINAAELQGLINVKITLPAGSQVGDTLTVSDGSVTNTFELTQAQIDAGQVLTGFLAPPSGAQVSITAILTDVAGNPSPQGSHSALVDTSGPSAASTQISIHPITADNIVNAVESQGTVNVTGRVSGEYTPGDAVTLDINGQHYTGNLGADGSFTLSVRGQDLAADADRQLDLSVRITDPAGNQADLSASRPYTVDTQATAAPTVSIQPDSDNNGFVNATEYGRIQNIPTTVMGVRVTLPEGAQEGDVLTVSDGTSIGRFTLSAQQLKDGFVDTSFKAPAEGQTLTVTAFLTDVAGNPSAQGQDAATVDTTGPSALTTQISIHPITADNIVNAAEAGGTVNVTGQVTGEYRAGDVVTVTVQGQAYTGSVGADGSFTIGVPGGKLVGDSDHVLDVSIRITDPAGNQADLGANRPYSVDTQATAAPTVTITEDTNDNGFISAAELNGVIGVKVDLPAGAQVGDVLSVSNGSTTVPFTLTAEQITAGQILTSFASPGEGRTLTVTAILTDVAGNPSAQGQDAATVDTTGPSALTTQISIHPITADNIVNAAEAGGTVNVTGQVTGEYRAGDVVTVTVQGQAYTGSVGADGSFTIGVPGAKLVGDSDHVLDVSIRITDPAGNQADLGANRPYSVDTQATAAPTVTITEDTNDNGFISAAELNGVIGVKVDLPAGAQVGDVLSVSNGSITTPFTLSAADITAGQVLTSFASPGEGRTLTVTAILTDVAGNPSAQGQDAATVDTSGPTDGPGGTTSLTLDAITADNVINAVEAGSTIAVTGHASGEFTTGDQVILSINGKTYRGGVDADGHFSIDVPGSDLANDPGHTLAAGLRATDAAGNQGLISASRNFSVDTQATGAPTVTITEDANDNGFINAAELNGVIGVKIDLPAGAVVGDVLQVSNGSTTVPFTLTAAQISDGHILTSFASPGEGKSLTVTAVLVDAAGNPSPQGSDTAAVDTTATAAPTVTIAEDLNNNGFIAASELSGQVDVRIDLPAGAQAGDKLTVSDGTTTHTFTLTQAQVDAHRVDTQFDAPPDGEVIRVTASLTDRAGNTSPESSDQAQIDVSGPSGAGTSLSVDMVTADNVLNAAEAGGTVTITGRASGEFSTGDQVTLGINGKLFTGQVDASGRFSIGVPGSDLAADGDHSISASLRATDVAGNQGNIVATRAFSVDTSATGAPTVTITEDANNNGYISAAEHSGDVEVHVVLPAGAQVGDFLIVSDGTHTDRFAINAKQLADGYIDTSFAAPADGGRITVTAILEDAAGNPSPQGSDTALVDLSGPTSASTHLNLNPITADNVINATESTSMVSVTGTVTGEFRQGDTVTLTVNGKNFSGAVAANGSFSIAVNGSDLAADADRRVDARIVATDAAGNQGTISTNHGYGVDTSPPGTPTVFILDDGDNNGLVTPGQFGGTLDVQVGLTGGVSVNDVLTVSNGFTSQNISITQAHINQGFVQTWFSMSASGSVSATAYITDGAGNRSGTGSDAITFYDPLVLDLDGDGVETLSIHEGVQFDLNADGRTDHTGWVGKDDGLLVMDRDGNGKIDDGRELFGDATRKSDGSNAQDGFQALADLDSNHDGKISASDEQYAALKVWRDADTDGQSDEGEVMSLSQMGIVEINLASTHANNLQSGNFITQYSSYTRADGSTLEMADVWLRTDSSAGAMAQQGEVHISGFDLKQGDALDLRDLLPATDGSAQDLSHFLDFDTTSQPGSTVVHISRSGQFTDAPDGAAGADQTLVLDGVNLRDALGLAQGTSDSQLIKSLLDQGRLLTDTGG